MGKQGSLWYNKDMDILKSTLNREYALRFLGVALLFIAFAGWFLYDGAVGYPEKNAAVEPVAKALAAQPLTGADWVNVAKTGRPPLAVAFEKAGLETPSVYSDTFTSWVRAGDPRANSIEEARKVLSRPVYSDEDIRSQYISAAVGLLAALGLMALVFVRWMTRYELSADTLTVYSPNGAKTYPLSTLKDVDRAQWKRGIAKLHFEGGNVTLDAWHHAGIKAMVERLAPEEAKAE